MQPRKKYLIKKSLKLKKCVDADFLLAIMRPLLLLQQEV
jgi:hypothetical protein